MLNLKLNSLKKKIKKKKIKKEKVQKGLKKNQNQMKKKNL